MIYAGGCSWWIRYRELLNAITSEIVKTTAGRVIFNDIVPKGIYLSVNRDLGKKHSVNLLTSVIVLRPKSTVSLQMLCWH